MMRAKRSSSEIVRGVGAVRTRGDKHGGRGVRKEESTSFLKKRSKKLLVLWVRGGFIGLG
ncbi:MAG: hypothetical protein B7X49_12780, partial [Acidiphilium sp. 34-64-41]